MNIFKGLLFLHGHIDNVEFGDFTDVTVRRDYGAHTAARELAPPLGNQALSRRWFGAAAQSRPQVPDAGCIVGGCG